LQVSVKSKNLSNPFSTGGGGPHFEAHVQASFVGIDAYWWLLSNDNYNYP
jgi:hypothetical protein